MAAGPPGVAGATLRPGEHGYDEARRVPIPGFEHRRPVAVVRCASAGDVAAGLALARELGAPVAVRSGGHCFAGRSSTDGVVLDVGPMRDIELEPDGLVRIGAGARLGDVYAALERHGLALNAGCGPTVGIAGLTLGGGLGILGRTYGLLSDRLRAAEVVLPDGGPRTVDAEHDAELFWGLRGAGGARFAVVTALVFEPVPAPATTGFELAWAPEHAGRVLDAWQHWSPDAPEALAASFVLRARDGAGITLVRVFGAMAAPEADLRPELCTLAAAAGPPMRERCRSGPFRGAKRFLNGVDEEGPPVQPVCASEFLDRPLAPDDLRALVAHLAADAGVAGERELDCSPWAGAYTRVATDATAFPHRAARVLVKHGAGVDPAAPAAEREAARAWVRRSRELAHPSGTGGAYVNFPDGDLDAWDAAYLGANRERLLALKHRCDPAGVLG